MLGLSAVEGLLLKSLGLSLYSLALKFVWFFFMFSISAELSFYSRFFFFLILLNCLSVFYSSLRICRTIILNYLSGCFCISVSLESGTGSLLFLLLVSCFLIFHDPYSLAEVSVHLKKQSPLPDFMD